jgi:cytochrome c556
MKLISFANGPVGAMMRGTTPFDTAAVKVAADRLVVLAPMIPGVFATDTSASSLETEALPSIWANKADFDMKAAALLTAAEALSAAAATGDEAATRAAVAGIGSSCSGCHDDYRE